MGSDTTFSVSGAEEAMVTHDVYFSGDRKLSLRPPVLWERLGEVGPLVPANVDRNPWAIETQPLFSVLLVEGRNI